MKAEERQALGCLERAVVARPDHAEAHLALAELLGPHALALPQRAGASYAGASAEGARAFEECDAGAAPGQRDGGGKTGVAAADDGNLGLKAHPRNQVLPAIQILRTGVSEVRRSSTWKPSASISSSRVR